MAAMDVEMAAPVGPVIASGYSQGHGFEIPAYQSDVDLCQLLQALSLTKAKLKAPETETVGHAPSALQSANEHDASTRELTCHSDASGSSSSKSSSSVQLRSDPLTTPTIAHRSPFPGCHFLQSILASLAPESPALSPSPYPYPAVDAFQTTSGVYLDTLLLHRSLLSAFPAAHKGCAAILDEIAKAVELRPWQADRDSDAEAVAALRQEACVVAHWV